MFVIVIGVIVGCFIKEFGFIVEFVIEEGYDVLMICVIDDFVVMCMIKL